MTFESLRPSSSIEYASAKRYLKARRPELYGKMVEPQESVTLPGWQMERRPGPKP